MARGDRLKEFPVPASTNRVAGLSSRPILVFSFRVEIVEGFRRSDLQKTNQQQSRCIIPALCRHSKAFNATAGSLLIYVLICSKVAYLDDN
jgi:hypothetical protein